MHHWEIWLLPGKLHGKQPASIRCSSAWHSPEKKTLTVEWLHTGTRFRLIIQINTSLFIKWNLSLFTVNRGVCMHSTRCKTHTDTDAHMESANERRRCVFLLPDGVWVSKYTHTQALLSVCVCVCVCVYLYVCVAADSSSSLVYEWVSWEC